MHEISSETRSVTVVLHHESKSKHAVTSTQVLKDFITQYPDTRRLAVITIVRNREFNTNTSSEDKIIVVTGKRNSRLTVTEIRAEVKKS